MVEPKEKMGEEEEGGMERGKGGGETNRPSERPQTIPKKRVRRTASERGWCLGWTTPVAMAMVVVVVAGRQPGRPRANGDERVDARCRENRVRGR